MSKMGVPGWSTPLHCWGPWHTSPSKCTHSTPPRLATTWWLFLLQCKLAAHLKFTINPQFPWVKFRYQSPTRNGVIPAPVDFNCLTLIQQIQTSSLAVDVQWLPWLHEGQGVEPRDGSCYVLVPVSFLLSFIQTNDYWQPMYIYVIYWSFSIANPWFSSSISCDISTVFSTEYPKWIITRSVIWKWHLHSMSQYFQERNVVEYSRPWRICAITKITY